MTTTTGTAPETRSFEADVARLLHMMVHSVYSDKDVFLRELISNAADACEKLRYELLSDPALAGDDGQPRITVTLDPEARRSEEHTSELQSLMRISYAVFCLKKQTINTQ